MWAPGVLLAVAAGSALGAAARYGLSVALLALLGPGLGWGTLVANAAGSFAIGFHAALAARGGLAGPRWRGFVATGFCGGFTSFSVFSLEAVAVAEEAPGRALLLVAGSVLIWLLAVAAGRRLGARGRRPG